MTAKTRKQLKQQRLDQAQVTEDGLSHHEIAKIMDISVAEVRKLEKSALSKLKTPTLMNQDLYSYWNLGLKPEDTTGFE